MCWRSSALPLRLVLTAPLSRLPVLPLEDRSELEARSSPILPPYPVPTLSKELDDGLLATNTAKRRDWARRRRRRAARSPRRGIRILPVSRAPLVFGLLQRSGVAANGTGSRTRHAPDPSPRSSAVSSARSTLCCPLIQKDAPVLSAATPQCCHYRRLQQYSPRCRHS